MVKGSTLQDLGIRSVPDQIKDLLKAFTEEELRTGIPAKVVSTKDYESLQCVDVIPCFDKSYDDGVVLPAAQINKVFVSIYHGGGFSVKLPIAVGDIVKLHYSHKYLGEFLNGDGQNIAQNVKLTTSERDCWVEQGFGTRKNHQSPSATNMVIEGKGTQITITPEGELSLVTDGATLLKTSEYTVDAPKTTFKGEIIVEGDSTIQGAANHMTTTTTIGVSTAASFVVAGTSFGLGASGVSVNSVRINGKEVDGHTHDVYTEGSPTSPF